MVRASVDPNWIEGIYYPTRKHFKVVYYFRDIEIFVLHTKQNIALLLIFSPPTFGNLYLLLVLSYYCSHFNMCMLVAWVYPSFFYSKLCARLSFRKKGTTHNNALSITKNIYTCR